jgi:flagellar biogenesis protein FliO
MPGTGVEAGASYGDLLVTSLIVLGAVCVAAFVAVRLFGRFLSAGRVRGAHLLDVVARVPLEPRRSLYVVAVAGKTLLVGTSEMGLSVLSELDAAEVKARVVPQQTFAELVRGAWQRRKGLVPRVEAAATAAEPAREVAAHDGTAAEPAREVAAHDGATAAEPARAAAAHDGASTDA